MGVVFCLIFYEIKLLEVFGILLVVNNFVGLLCGFVFVIGFIGLGKLMIFVGIIDLVNCNWYEYIMMVEDLIEFLYCYKNCFVN